MIPAPLQNLFDRLSVAWHERAVALKAISFAMVGVVNSVIDFGVFSLGYYLPFSGDRRQYARLGGRGQRLLRLELDDHLRHVNPAASSVCAVTSISRCRRSPGSLPTPRRSGACVVLLFVPAWAAEVAAIAVSFVVNFSLSHFLVFRVRR